MTVFRPWCCMKGHAMTLLLNEAYATLMDESLRGTYNEAHSHKAAMRAAGHTAFTGSPFSQWVGPDRPQGIFVDENVCIGRKRFLCILCLSTFSFLVLKNATSYLRAMNMILSKYLQKRKCDICGRVPGMCPRSL
jgi:hypothetical protein